MAFVAAPTQGTGSNKPQGTLAGSWVKSSENHSTPVVNNDIWTSTQNTNLILVPQVYSGPV